jgi:uncharacterized protein
MKVALVGATGFVGSKILAEAVARGHTVTAIRRHTKNVLQHERVKAVFADIADAAALSRVFRGHDAAIHAYTPPVDPEAHAYVTTALRTGDHRLETIANYVPRDPAASAAHVKGRVQAQRVGTLSFIQAAKSAGVQRILAVGGAATLRIDGVPYIDRPDFPRVFEGGARSTAVIKDLLMKETEINWTLLCPPTMIVPGKRTGKFRLGLDDLLIAPDGTSSISLEDFAMALIDELEAPQHTGRRFTVGY